MQRKGAINFNKAAFNFHFSIFVDFGRFSKGSSFLEKQMQNSTDYWVKKHGGLWGDLGCREIKGDFNFFSFTYNFKFKMYYMFSKKS